MNMIPIFLSRPNPYTYEQKYLLDTLVNKMNSFNLLDVTLKAKDYNPYESLNCLLEMIKRCYGMIILAFGQYYIEKGTSKYGANNKAGFFDAKEITIDQKWITSPYCQIEGAIAFGNKIPILILEQKDIKIEGILKMGDHAIHGPQFNIYDHESTENYFNHKDFVFSFNEWYKLVTDLYAFTNHLER